MCIHGTHSLLYVPQFLLGLHKSTCIQIPLNWTGIYRVMDYLWMAWVMQLVLQRTQYQILFYGKKLRKFSSREIVQRFQPCFAEQISFIDTWAGLTSKRTFLNCRLLSIFPLQKRWNLSGSRLKTDVCFCQSTVESIRFGNVREIETCGWKMHSACLDSTKSHFSVQGIPSPESQVGEHCWPFPQQT